MVNQTTVEYATHVRTAGSALKRWFIATCYDALAVGFMWAVGLLILGVPWWPLWAVLGGAFQFVPNIGPALSLIGPAVAISARAAFGQDYDFMHLVYLLILYALIVIVDGLVLQPYLMKRSNRVPIWASIATPLVLGFFFSFWGVLLAAPVLAVVYALRTSTTEAQGHREIGS